MICIAVTTEMQANIMNVFWLPTELWVEVFHSLSAESWFLLLPLCITCKSFFQIIKFHFKLSPASSPRGRPRFGVKTEHILDFFVEQRHSKLVQHFIISWKWKPDFWTFAISADAGDLGLARWLYYDARCQWNHWAHVRAHVGGEMADWLLTLENNKHSDGQYFIMQDTKDHYWDAITSGNMRIINWLATMGLPSDDPKYCAQAASCGHLDILVWLRKFSISWDKRPAVYAIRGGHHHVLRWAILNKCPFDKWVLNDEAVKNGDLDSVKVLIELGLFKYHSAYNLAAREGHLKLLMWMRENKVQGKWNTSTSNEAIASNHLEVFKYLVEQGCPWSISNSYQTAIYHGHLEILKYIISKVPNIKNDCLLSAKLRRQKHIVQWLREEILKEHIFSAENKGQSLLAECLQHELNKPLKNYKFIIRQLKTDHKTEGSGFKLFYLQSNI